MIATLTNSFESGIVSPHCQKGSAGRGNPFSKGAADSAISAISVFLCLPVRRGINPRIRHGGLVGAALRLAVPLRGISTPDKPATPHRGKCNGGLSSLAKELPQ